jgi:siroheme decarboxylase
MVVWDLPEDRIEPAGRALATHPGVTLAYRRRPVPGIWDWQLYCMIHGQSRPETLGVLEAARALPALEGARHKILFSTRCFRQSGARLMEAA